MGLFEDLSPGQTVCVFTGLMESSGPERERVRLVGPLAVWLEASRFPLLVLSFPICFIALLFSGQGCKHG